MGKYDWQILLGLVAVPLFLLMAIIGFCMLIGWGWMLWMII